MIQNRPITQTVPIQLSDKDFEDEATLKAVLDTITKVDSYAADMLNKPASKVYAFYKKYCFDRELRLVRDQLFESADSERYDKFDVFVHATHLEEYHTAGLAIQSDSNSTWSEWPEYADEEPDIFGSAKLSGWIFDLRSAPQDELDQIPRDAHWALSRASLLAGPRTPEGWDGKAVAKEYIRLMSLRGQYPTSADTVSSS